MRCSVWSSDGMVPQQDDHKILSGTEAAAAACWAVASMAVGKDSCC